MADSADLFRERVRACTVDVTTHLPGLAARYSPLALLAALTEHVGGSLRLAMRAGRCTEEQARAVLQRAEEIAFHSDR